VSKPTKKPENPLTVTKIRIQDGSEEKYIQGTMMSPMEAMIATIVEIKDH